MDVLQQLPRMKGKRAYLHDDAHSLVNIIRTTIDDLDGLTAEKGFDQRAIALARTKLQEAGMWLVQATPADRTAPTRE